MKELQPYSHPARPPAVYVCPSYVLDPAKYYSVSHFLFRVELPVNSRRLHLKSTDSEEWNHAASIF